MTGRIKSLDPVSGSGLISAADGLLVGFCPSAILAYDLPTLVIGQVVSFDLEGGRRPRALNVCVQRPSRSVDAAKEKRLGISCLRYIGFEQAGNTRTYLFEGLAPGMESRALAVEADLALFTRHHVGMQEGPALCLHLLVERLDAEGTASQTSLKCSLSDREMLAILASRPVGRSMPRPRRASPRTWH